MAEPQVNDQQLTSDDVHLILMRLHEVGKYVGVEPPANGQDVYTAEYGAQVVAALEARLGSLDTPDAAKLADLSSIITSGIRSQGGLEPLNFTGDVAGFGEYLKTIDETVTDTLSKFEPAELNFIFHGTNANQALSYVAQVNQNLGLEAPQGYSPEYGLSLVDFAKTQAHSTVMSSIDNDAVKTWAEGYWNDWNPNAPPAMPPVQGMDELKAFIDTAKLDIASLEGAVNYLNSPELAAVMQNAPTQPSVAGGVQVDTAPAAIAQEPQPDRVLSAEVIADNQLVQEKIAAAIGVVKAEGGIRNLLEGQGVDVASIPDMEVSENGQWTAESLASLNGLVDMLKGPLGIEGTASGYQAGMDDGFKAAFAELEGSYSPEDMLKARVFSEVISAEDRVLLLDALERLAVADELKPVQMIAPEVAPTALANGGAGTQQPEATDAEAAAQEDSPAATTPAAPTGMSEAAAIGAVEGTLMIVGTEIENMLGGDAAGLAGKIGLDASIVFDPLTDEDLLDDGFGQRSQDMAAFTIMGLKKLAGQENPDGTYNAAIGRDLQIAIMTQPQFAQVRNSMGIQDYGTSDENKALAEQLINHINSGPPQPPEALAAGASEEDQQRHAILTDEYNRQRDAYLRFDTLNQQRIEDLKKMTDFFRGMDVLQQAGTYDNDQAKETSEFNTYLTIAGDLMDKYMPGLKVFLQDFFENNAFGQMLAGIMGMQGINVGRLWGDRNDAAAIENAAPRVANKFDEYYAGAQEELGEGQHSNRDIVEQVRAMMDQDLNGGGKIRQWLTEKGLDIVFKDLGKEGIEKAMNLALDQAAGADNQADARQAFTQSMIDAAKILKENPEFDRAQLEEAIAALPAEARAFESTLTPEERAEQSNGPENDVAAGAVVEDAVHRPGEDGAEVMRAHQRTTGEPAASQIEVRPLPELAGGPPAQTEDQPQGEVIGRETTGVDITYFEDMGPYPQLTRWANDRVAPVADVFERNYDTMKFSAQPLSVLDGQKYMTVEFIGFLEEAYVRAQIDDHLRSEGGTLDNLDLSKIDHKFDGEQNLDTVLEYMRRSGVSEADISVVAENITSLDTDYRSPNAPGGGDHKFSVWDHSNALNAYTRDGERVGISRDGDVFANAGQVDVERIIREIRAEIEPEPEPEPEPVPRVEVEAPEEEVPSYVTTLPEDVPARQPGDLFEYKPPPQASCGPAENFMHLGQMTETQERLLNNALYEAMTIPEGRANAGYNPLDVNRNSLDQMLARGFVQGAEYSFLEPKDFIDFDKLDANTRAQLENIDVVVAERTHQGMNIKFVNYEQHGIRPLDEHRRRDFNERYDPQDTIDGNRRFDDVMYARSRYYDGIEPAAVRGYTSMGAVVPASAGMNGFTGVPAYEAIYPKGRNEDSHAYRQEIGEYHQGFEARAFHMGNYEGRLAASARGTPSRAFDVDGQCGVVTPRETFREAVGREGKPVLPVTQSLPAGLQRGPIGAATAQWDVLMNKITGRAGHSNPQSEGYYGSHPHIDIEDRHTRNQLAEQMRDMGVDERTISGFLNQDLSNPDYNNMGSNR